MVRFIDANFAQHIANVELSPDNAGIIQWVLSHTPTIDAAIVVHGRWIETEDGETVCSCCNARIPEMYSNADTVLRYECRYCHSCGSKMDGEAK